MTGDDRFWNVLSEARKDEKAGFLAPARYELQACLGEGATSIVYRAFDRELSRTVALKVIKVKVLDEFRRRLDREVKAMAKLSHPGIVRLHDLGEHEGRLYLVMECVQGGSLAARLESSSTPRTDLLPLLEKVAEALQEAHRNGIVHRDLKPENILLTPEGEPKITDFGLAKTIEEDKTFTQAGIVVGTPMYMAPEQIRGEAPTPRTDIYALGVILYRVLTGRTPFDAPGITELFVKVLNERARIDPAVPPNLAAVALKALEKHPADRYWSAEAFAQDLRWCRENRQPAAAQPDPMRAIRRLVRKPALIGGAIAILAVVGLWSVIPSSNDLSIQRLMKEGAQQENRGNWSEARDTFRNVLTLAAGNAEALSGIKRAEEMLKRIEADRKAANDLVDGATPLLEKATEAFYRKDADLPMLFRDVERARDQLELALKKVPGHVAGNYQMGRAWYLLGWLNRAESSWKAVFEADGAHKPAHFHMGRLLQLRSYLESLGNDGVLSAERRQDSENMARYAIEHLNEAAVGEESLQSSVALAVLAFVEMHDERALKLAAEGLARYPTQDGREEFFWIRGLVHLRKGASKEALEAFNEAIRIRPWYPLAYFCRAQVRLPEEAIADYTDALKTYPRFVEALNNRGWQFWRLGRMEEALADFSRAVELQPNEWTYANRGVIYGRMGREREALEDFEKSLTGRWDSIAHYYRGEYYVGKQMFREALDDFDHCEKGSVEVRVNRSISLNGLGRFDEAVADCTNALKIKPGFPNALAVRGDALASLGKRAEALKDFEEAFRLAPADWPGRAEVAEKIRLLKK